MTSRQSAGLLPFRRGAGGTFQVFLVHPGGPFWARKDEGAWSLAKGEFEPHESPLAAARREFQEETGFVLDGDFLSLGSVRQPGGKTVHAWAVQAELDPGRLSSNTFSMEWPRGSGRMQEFPEVDRGAWFSLEEARRRILTGQLPLLEVLQHALEQLP